MYVLIIKSNSMILQNKNAVIYGAGGSLGGAVVLTSFILFLANILVWEI